jgi:hypothetical protein
VDDHLNVTWANGEKGGACSRRSVPKFTSCMAETWYGSYAE